MFWAPTRSTTPCHPFGAHPALSNATACRKFGQLPASWHATPCRKFGCHKASKNATSCPLVSEILPEIWVSHGRNELAPLLTLLANSLHRVVKLFKSGNPGRSERITVEPSDETDEVDRCGNAKMLQMRFRQPQISGTTQIKGTYPL